MRLGFEAPNIPRDFTADEWERIDALNSGSIKVRPYNLTPANLADIRHRNLTVILRPNADEGVNFSANARHQKLASALDTLLAYTSDVWLIPDNEVNHPNNHTLPSPDYWAKCWQVVEWLAQSYPAVRYLTPPLATGHDEAAWYAAGAGYISRFDGVAFHAYGQLDTGLLLQSLHLAKQYGLPLVADEVGDSHETAGWDKKGEALRVYLDILRAGGVAIACIFHVGGTPEWSNFVPPIEVVRMLAASAPDVVVSPVETPIIAPNTPTDANETPLHDVEGAIPLVETNLSDVVESALFLAPGPQRPASKPLVWDWHERNIIETATYRPNLSTDEVVTIALGLGAVIYEESGGNLHAKGDRRADGFMCSRSLFQTNACGGAGSALMQRLGLTSADQLENADVQYLHARMLIDVLETELYWSRVEGRPFNAGKAIQSVQRSSSDPTGAGYQAAYETLRRELTPVEGNAMATVRIGNLDVPDLRGRYPSTYASRELSQITNISVHHSATPTLPESATEAEEIAALDSIHAYHLKEFKGISYHAAVFLSGRLYHLADWATIRYLVGGQANVHTLGLLFHGTFMGFNPSDLQIEAGQSFIANARMQLGNAAVSVLGHQDISPTACPGDGWNVWKHRLTGEPAPVPTPEPTPEPDALTIQLDSIYGQTETMLNAIAGIRAAVIAIKDGRG